jgi:hypothetical protein
VCLAKVNISEVVKSLNGHLKITGVTEGLATEIPEGAGALTGDFVSSFSSS